MSCIGMSADHLCCLMQDIVKGCLTWKVLGLMIPAVYMDWQPYACVCAECFAWYN